MAQTVRPGVWKPGLAALHPASERGLHAGRQKRSDGPPGTEEDAAMLSARPSVLQVVHQGGSDLVSQRQDQRLASLGPVGTDLPAAPADRVQLQGGDFARPQARRWP